MELRQLRYLLAIATESNFTRAAEKLFVTQSALSQQIQKLEEEIGEPLIDRHHRQSRLTPAGAILADHARQIIREIESAQTAIRELNGLQRGLLRVGTVQTINAYLMPRVVAAFTRAYPQVTLQIEELAASAIENGLQSGDLELGIGFIPTTLVDLASSPLFTEELVLIVANTHPSAAFAELPLNAVENISLALLPESFCTRRLWDTAALSVGIQPIVRVEMNTIHSLLATVSQSSLGTILPHLAIASTDDASLRVIRLYDPTQTRTVGLLRVPNCYQSAAARAFEAILREQFAEIAAGVVRAYPMLESRLIEMRN